MWNEKCQFIQFRYVNILFLNCKLAKKLIVEGDTGLADMFSID